MQLHWAPRLWGLRAMVVGKVVHFFQIVLADLHRLRILIFCQNKMNSTTLQQLTKDERLNQWKPNISCKPAQNFVRCSHLKFLSFLGSCKSLYITFIIHKEQFAFQLPSPCIWRTWSGPSLVKSGSFHVLRHKADKRYKEPVCACGYQKWDKQSVHISSFLQVSYSSNESSVQQKWSNWVVS